MPGWYVQDPVAPIEGGRPATLGMAVLRPFALRLVLPMALVVLALFGLLAYEACLDDPAGSRNAARHCGASPASCSPDCCWWRHPAAIPHRAARPIVQLTGGHRAARPRRAGAPRCRRGPLLGRLQRGVNDTPRRRCAQPQPDGKRARQDDGGAGLTKNAGSRPPASRGHGSGRGQPRPAPAAVRPHPVLVGPARQRIRPAKLAQVMRIEECVASLDHLFSELLDLSRLETGAVHPVIGDVRVDDVFDDVSRNFRMLAESGAAPGGPQDRCLGAHRPHHAPGSSTTWSATRCATPMPGRAAGRPPPGLGEVRIDVWDSGRGIAPEHQPKVFEEFYQVASPTPGDGERQRGLEPGAGHRAQAWRLVGLPDHARFPPGPRDLHLVDAARRGAGCPARHPPDADLPLDVGGLRVLVVDDEPSILEGLRALLAEWGCDIERRPARAGALAAIAGWIEPPTW